MPRGRKKTLSDTKKEMEEAEGPADPNGPSDKGKNETFIRSNKRNRRLDAENSDKADKELASGNHTAIGRDPSDDATWRDDTNKPHETNAEEFTSQERLFSRKRGRRNIQINIGN